MAVEGDGVGVFRFPYHTSYMLLQRIAQAVVQEAYSPRLLLVHKHFSLEEVAAEQNHHLKQHTHKALRPHGLNQVEEYMQKTFA